MAKNQNIFGISEDKLNVGGLGGRYTKSWVEESLYFSDTPLGGEPARNVSYLGVSITRRRLLIFGGLMLLGIFIIFGRIFYLQIINGSKYRALAEGNRIRLMPIPAERGVFYDNQGRQLVQNIPSFSLVVTPRDLPRDSDQRELVLQKAAVLSGVPYQQVAVMIKQYGAYGYESMVIKENLDHTAALRMYIQNADLPGVTIESGTKRYYLNQLSFDKTSSSTPVDLFSLSHLLGYMGKLDINELRALNEQGYLPSDEIGKTGLEKEYETNLRGQNGREKIEVDALGHEQVVLAEDPPTPGANLHLTIDAQAQAVLETFLNKRLKSLNLKRAAAVAINPQTGGILAMVSTPAFDDNDFSGGISNDNYQKYLTSSDQPLFDRAISGVYPSGSTVKPVIVAGALEEHVITKDTTVNSVGGIQVGKWFFKDWKAGGHGITNAVRAIAWSINTFFYYVGGGYGNFVGLGVDRLVKYFLLFNLGQITGVDLPGEQSGFVPTPEWKQSTKGEQWYVGDTYNLSIGQGDLLVTPLQVAVWTAAVANGGQIVTPHLADYFVDDNNQKISLDFPIKKKNIVSASSINVARAGMRECVLSGSCQLLRSLSFPAAGKTGTAQWNSNRATHAWFTSFAPYDNPQIAVVVLVEEGGEGSVAAMPVARDFLQWWGTKYLK